MVTRKQLEAAFSDDKAFTKDIDYKAKAIMLLRERIPYEECKSIISGAEHEVIYLCDIDKVIPYITEGDLLILVDCGCWIDNDFDCIAMFV